MENLFFFNYNNYFNRQVKQVYDDIDSYGEPLAVISNCSFNPNDNIMTTHKLNTYEYDLSVFIEPDYVIATDLDSEILSRWFVIDSKRLLNGQWELSLKRDVIADNIQNVLSAPIFIEKGTIRDILNPLIFNNEDMGVNEIKKSQDVLYDKTKTPWIIGYVAENMFNDGQDINVTIPKSQDYAYVLDNYNELSQYTYNNPNKILSNWTLRCFVSNQERYSDTKFKGYIPIATIDSYSGNENTAFYKSRVGGRSRWTVTSSTKAKNLAKEIRDYVLNDVPLTNIFKNKAGVSLNTGTLMDYQGRIVKHGPDYFRIRYHSKEQVLLDIGTVGTYSTGDDALLYNTVSNIMENSQYTEIFNDGIRTSVDYRVGYTEEYLTFESVSVENYNLTIKSTINVLQDAPYYMFALKYTPTNVRIAIEMKKMLAAAVYDIQVLPYFPEQAWIGLTGEIDRTALNNNYDYTEIKDENSETTDYVYWARFSNFTFNIDYDISIPVDPLDFKVEALTTKYRLVAPNGSGIFEFNPMKNYGVNFINVDATYKPINPYLHLNPNFKGLYGADYDDPRGLIIAGDYSLPMISDKWAEYQQQNKNFQAAFDRQIQHMDFNNNMRRASDAISGVVGTIQGVSTGAAAGAMTGNPVATAAGAVIGGVTSAFGGIADGIINERLYQEQRSYTMDQFGYQLGNIQALPYSISKVGGITLNNPLVPYIEYYTCTEEEKEALRNKIRYNGMTVMVIGKIEDYISGEGNDYVKGRFIRVTDIQCDSHVLFEISKELNMGVFM